MNFMVTTVGNDKSLITQQQRDKLVSAIEAGAKHIMLNQSYMPVSSIMSIIPVDEYLASENRKLNRTGKYMCRHGVVHFAESRCECPPSSRICNGPPIITTAERIECQECHTLCYASNEFCDSCNTNLLLEKPKEMQRLGEAMRSIVLREE